MEYKHIKTIKDNDGLCILIEVESVEMWIDCWKYKDEWEIDFNKYIFNVNSKKDMKEKELQNKISYEDYEAFYYFIDEILAGLDE